MPLALSIQPFSDVLDMYGDADSSSAFSLSGHVSVTLSSPSSLLVRRRSTTRVLLQSLTVTFEGQSEVLTPSTGYTPIRLCSITRELLPGGALDLSNEGHEDKSCLWNIVFDIPVPGWLPTTSLYGDASLQSAGTSYALYASATFADMSHGHSLFSIVNFCGTARSRTRMVEANRYPIVLQRFVESQPGSSSSSAFPMSVYIVDACRALDPERPPRESIPNNVLEKIQVVASIPSATAMNEAFLPFVLRVRGKKMDDSKGKSLRVTEFSVDVEQVEVYRNNSTPNDVSQFPIPSQSHQPPRIPLRESHPIRNLYDTGFLGTFRSSVKRSFSILAPTESGRYIVSGESHIFAHGQSESSEDNWYILETKIPILTDPYLRDWAGYRKRRITERSPLFTVEHYVHVVIHCEYIGSDETILERLDFSLPMRHVNVSEVPMSSNDVTGNQGEDVRKNLPRKKSLPAYSQLFHLNGEQKVDSSIPLPLYEPPSSPPMSAFASD